MRGTCPDRRTGERGTGGDPKYQSERAYLGGVQRKAGQ